MSKKPATKPSRPEPAQAPADPPEADHFEEKPIIPLFQPCRPCRRYFLGIWGPTRLPELIAILNRENLILHSLVPRPMSNMFFAIVDGSASELNDDAISKLIEEVQ